VGHTKVNQTQNSQGKPSSGFPSVFVVAAFVLSALLLTFCQAPWDLSLLAWIALVPFVLGCRPEFSKKLLVIMAYLVSCGWWLGNLYWIIPITGPGYIAFAAFQALYWPLLALGVRFLRAKNWPMALAAPLLFVGAESIQSFLFTGFNWYFLAHSQYSNTTLIQATDVFGTFGISALIAAVNGVIVDGILAYQTKTLRQKQLWIETAAIVVLIGITLFYGRYQQAEANLSQELDSPPIGIVQTNVPSTVKEEAENAQDILNTLFSLSDQCLAAGAKLIIWPETMVLAILNPGYRMYCYPNSEPERLHQQIAEYAKTNLCYVVVGARAANIGDVGGKLDVTEQFNSAYLYTPEGFQSSQRYDKIHLVPFGEYIPFKKSFPPLYKVFTIFNPYDFDYTLTPGNDYTAFPVRLNQETYAFSVLICYEDTDPAISRHAVYQGGKKRINWIVNMSNDGWYVHFKDGKVIPSVELAQRTAISVFRCIENRISIVRSVNTGISCLIDPYGRIQNQYLAGNLPKNVMSRQGVEGWFASAIPQSNIVTFYARFGDWIDKTPTAALIAVFISYWIKNRIRRNKP
jgi:apolipoprotein N-acyltransferase